MTAVNGAVVWSAKYSSFLDANVDPSSTITNNLRAPGQYFDEETNLHYNWNRYYVPDIGRYLTPDPIGLAGDFNLYNYCFGDPVGFYDEEGLSAKSYGLCVAACYLGVSAAEMATLFDEDKMPRSLRRQYEKEIRKNYKKKLRQLTKRQQKEFINDVVKRKAKKKAKKFLMKKVGIRLATKLAPNAIPGLGQVVSGVLMAGDIIKVGYCATVCARGECL